MDLNNLDLALQASLLILLAGSLPGLLLTYQLIIGMGERDWWGLTCRDIVHEASTSAANLQRVETGFQTAACGRAMPGRAGRLARGAPAAVTGIAMSRPSPD